MGSRVNEAHIDKALTNYVQQLPVKQGLISPWLCPAIPVQKETDKYWTYSREELKEHQLHRADGAEANEFEWAVSTASYACEEYAQQASVTERQLANADKPIRPKMDGAEKLRNLLAIGKERRVQSLVQTASNWNGSTTPTTKWNASSGVDVEDDIEAAKQAFFLQSGTYPNVAVINDKVRDAIIKWLRSQPNGATLRDWRSLDVGATAMSGPDPVLAGLFGIEKWLVGKQLVDSNGRGQSESLARLWGDHCTLLYIEPSPGFMKASAMYTFQKMDYVADGWRVASRSGEFIRIRHILVEKIMSNLLGYHLYTVLS